MMKVARIGLWVCMLLAIAGCGKRPSLQRNGGTILVYDLAVGLDGQPVNLDQATKEQMILAMQQRLDPSKRLGIEIAFRSDGRLEIGIPGSDVGLIQATKKLAETAGHLELLIVANKTDHANLIELARGQEGNLVYDGDKLVGKWVQVPFKKTAQGGRVPAVSIANDTIRDGQTGKWFGAAEGDEEFANLGDDAQFAAALAKQNIQTVELLMAVDPKPSMNFQGKHIRYADNGIDERGSPCLFFSASPEGAAILRRVTTMNLPDESTQTYRRLGIVIDNQVISAPRILSEISESGQITGEFTPEEMDRLAIILRAGNLPVALQTPPVEERTVTAGQ